MINEDMDHVVIHDGDDLVVSDDDSLEEYGAGGRTCNFYCNITEMLCCMIASRKQDDN